MNKIEFLYNKDKYQGIDSSKALSHYGILGQKWGQRRWQNADGTFNEAGKERYFGPSGTTKKNKLENQKIGGFGFREIRENRDREYNLYSQNDQNSSFDPDKRIVPGTNYSSNTAYDPDKRLGLDFLGDTKIGSTTLGFDKRGKAYYINDKYQNADGTLTKKGLKMLKKGKNIEDFADAELYEKSKMTPEEIDAYDEKKYWNPVREIDNKIQTTKELKGKDITDEEFKTILNDTTSMYELRQDHSKRQEYNDVGDLTLLALKKAGWLDNDATPGNDDSRFWALNEDQTIGLGALADLYYKGYSKDYIKQFIDKTEKMTNDDFDKYPGAWEISYATDYDEGKKFVDALFSKDDTNIDRFGSQPDQKIGSIFNKKNVSYSDPKYNPYINEENKMWDNVKEQQGKNWAKDKELVDYLAGKELKYYSEDPIISEYYSNIKADIANKMKEKYPSMNPNTIRMNTLHDENEPFVSGYDGQEELREQYKELHEKAMKYPPRSAKRVKFEGEAALANAKEELNQKKIEEELNENVEKYIKENKNNILQDIDRIRGKIKDINIVDDFGDYYVTRALEEHNKKKYNNFNEKGLKDLSDDEWDDVKNIARAEYEDDISRRNKLFNDQKIGSINSKEDAKANKEAVKMLADLNDKDYRKRAETLQKLYDDPRFEEQRNNVDKAIKEKFKDDFDELEKTYGDFDKVENEYLALAGLNRALMDDGGKMEDISYMPRLYLYDDLNQGSLTAESIWAYDNGIDDSWDRWEKMVNKENSTRDELLSSLSNDGSYNSKVLSKLDDETKKDIVDHIYNYKSVPSSYWTLYNAGDTSKSEYDSVKDTTLKEAREISKKLSSSCGSDASGWALLNKAVNNLNLGGKDYTELTQADWDRINAEINSLKR